MGDLHCRQKLVFEHTRKTLPGGCVHTEVYIIVTLSVNNIQYSVADEISQEKDTLENVCYLHPKRH